MQAIHIKECTALCFKHQLIKSVLSCQTVKLCNVMENTGMSIETSSVSGPWRVQRNSRLFWLEVLLSCHVNIIAMSDSHGTKIMDVVYRSHAHTYITQ